MSAQVSVLRIDRGGKRLEGIVIGMMQRAEEPQVVGDLMTQRFGQRVIVQHQSDVRSQHLQRFKIARAVYLLAFSCTQHESTNGAGTHAQRRNAFDGIEERSLRRAEEFVDVLLAVRYSRRSRLPPLMLRNAHQRQYRMRV